MGKQPIRILQVLPALNFCGGIESYVMNYYRHINKDLVQYDFITHTELENSYEEEILRMGGKVYKFPVFTIKNLPNILSIIDKFFKEHANEYVAIHCHMANAAYFYFTKAEKYGLNVRILHSHNAEAADILTHKIRNYPLLYLGNLLATHRVACTKLAGEFLFKGNSFKIVKNAIDVDRFKLDNTKRKTIRNEYCWNNKFVVGHIGRLSPQKNQVFAVRVFAELLKKLDNAHLVFIGSGEDEALIKAEIKKLRLESKVALLGTKENVWDFYQAFDVFLFPSLYEGLGIVLIEAQCSGLKCFATKDSIPEDAKVTDNLEFVSLSESPKIWAEKILKSSDYIRENKSKEIRKAGYDAEAEREKLEKYYLEFNNIRTFVQNGGVTHLLLENYLIGIGSAKLKGTSPVVRWCA